MQLTTTGFDELYEAYYADVYRFALWLSGNAEDAKDIAAETFVRVWTATDLKAETIKGYLLTIARNVFLQSRKRNKNRVELDADLVDPSPTANTLKESEDAFNNVMAALQKLPEIDRSILIMKAHDGLSYQEISNILGVPIPGLKVKVHRARYRLANIISQESCDENK